MHQRHQAELEAEEKQEEKPVAHIEEKQPVLLIRDIADSLKNFTYAELYSYFGGIACMALVDKLLPIENFLSGIIGCRMVPVAEFLKRTAVPAKWFLDAPKAFSIDSFREIFLEKLPSDHMMKFPQGTLNSSLVCMLVPWASVVDACLSVEASMEQFRKAEAVSQKLKKDEKDNLTGLTSDKLAHTPQLLDSILHSLEVLHKCQKLVPSETQYSKDEVKRFHDLSTAIVRIIIQTLGEIQETELSCEMSSAVAILKSHLKSLQDAAEKKCSGLLVNLLDATHAAVKSGKEDCRDRVNDPKKFFPCIAEHGADFMYRVLTSLIALKPNLASCLEKLIKAVSHPCLANIKDEDLNKVKDTLLNEAKTLKDELDSGDSGPMAVIHMVLADLIASSSLLTVYCFVLHC